MKKLLWILLLSVLVFTVNAEDLFDNVFFEKLKNDYVIYIDTRSGSPVLTGFQYQGGNSYLIRYYDFSADDNELSEAGRDKF